MTSTTRAPQEPLPSPQGGTPPLARGLVRVFVIVLLLGAGYLIAQRHEAILADLSTMTAWCF